MSFSRLYLMDSLLRTKTRRIKGTTFTKLLFFRSDFQLSVQNQPDSYTVPSLKSNYSIHYSTGLIQSKGLNISQYCKEGGGTKFLLVRIVHIR